MRGVQCLRSSLLAFSPTQKACAFMGFIIKSALRGARVFCKAPRPSRAWPCGVGVDDTLYHGARFCKFNRR